MMKRVGLTAAAILIVLSAFFLMYSFRFQSKVQLWKQYNIVYISTDYQEESVHALLDTYDADSIISRQNSLFNVRNRMLPTLAPYNNEGFSSEGMRSFFFRDKSDSYFLFYVPEESLDSVVTTLNKASIPFGIDASVEYPVLCPIICLIAFLVFMTVSRMKLSKALCLLPFISVTIAVPFYSVAASICCFLFVYCIADMYDMRNETFKVIVRKPSLWIVFLTGTFSVLLSGTRAVIFVLLGTCISALLLFIQHIVENTYRKEAHFQPVLILSAKWINERKRFNLKTLLTMLFFSVCFLVLTLLSDTIDAGISTQDLLLPSPSEYTDTGNFTVSGYTELSEMHDLERNPDLSDFLNEKWYAETAAYRKLGYSYQSASADEKVILPSFSEEDGLITENDVIMFCFNDEYISSTVETFRNMKGIEKLLVSEDCFFTTGYASTGKTEIPAFTIPLIVLSVLCFLILSLLYRLKRHDK